MQELAARAPRLVRAQDRGRPWLAPGVSARVTWSPARVVFVELEAGAAVSLVRDEIAVDRSVVLYRAPTVVPSFQADAGMRFP